MMKRRAVILLSGGLDSVTCLAMAKKEGCELFALTIKYGQRHICEIANAKKIARQGGVSRHEIMDIDLSQWGGSSLLDKRHVPKGRRLKVHSSSIPSTYVPGRNTVFLSLALSFAEAVGAQDIFIGVNAVDYSGYPDCRPVFIKTFQKLARIATAAGVAGKKIRIRAPLLKLSKGEIIKLGLKLGVDYSLTHSCYDPQAGGWPCGRCDSCLLREKGFAEAGVTDPLFS